MTSQRRQIGCSDFLKLLAVAGLLGILYYEDFNKLTLSHFKFYFGSLNESRFNFD